MACYLCGSEALHQRKDTVRDAPDMRILESDDCGLVTLDSTAHIGATFYQDSGMHGEKPMPMDIWLKKTDADDQRRF